MAASLTQSPSGYIGRLLGCLVSRKPPHRRNTNPTRHSGLRKLEVDFADRFSGPFLHFRSSGFGQNKSPNYSPSGLANEKSKHLWFTTKMVQPPRKKMTSKNWSGAQTQNSSDNSSRPGTQAVAPSRLPPRGFRIRGAQKQTPTAAALGASRPRCGCPKRSVAKATDSAQLSRGPVCGFRRR